LDYNLRLRGVSREDPFENAKAMNFDGLRKELQADDAILCHLVVDL